MMKFILFLVITVAAFSCFQGYADQVVSSSGEESKEHRSTMPQASYVIPQVVKEWRAHGKKFFLVDVREPSEYKAGHLSGAINVSYLDVEGAAKGFDHQVPYIFYCTLSAWRVYQEDITPIPTSHCLTICKM